MEQIKKHFVKAFSCILKCFMKIVLRIASFFDHCRVTQLEKHCQNFQPSFCDFLLPEVILEIFTSRSSLNLPCTDVINI